MTEAELEDIKRASQALDSDDPAEVEAAKQLFLELTKKDPAESYYVLAVGMAHSQQGSYAEAERCFERAIELSPTDFSAHVNRGHMRLRRGDAAGARADFMTALTLMPEESEGRLLVQATLAAMSSGAGGPH
jgi:Flp pilus assembly protein TadD